MKFLLIPFLLLCSCAPSETKIISVHEYTLKSTNQPDFDAGLLYTEYSAIMYGAIESKERDNRLGNYYYVIWEDSQPNLPAKLVFEYQQGATGSKVLSITQNIRPRKSATSNKTLFTFNGEKRKLSGDILAWKLTLWVNNKPVSSKQSFLWQDLES